MLQEYADFPDFGCYANEFVGAFGEQDVVYYMFVDPVRFACVFQRALGFRAFDLVE